MIRALPFQISAEPLWHFSGFPVAAWYLLPRLAWINAQTDSLWWRSRWTEHGGGLDMETELWRALRSDTWAHSVAWSDGGSYHSDQSVVFWVPLRGNMWLREGQNWSERRRFTPLPHANLPPTERIISLFSRIGLKSYLQVDAARCSLERWGAMSFSAQASLCGRSHLHYLMFKFARSLLPGFPPVSSFPLSSFSPFPRHVTIRLQFQVPSEGVHTFNCFLFLFDRKWTKVSGQWCSGSLHLCRCRRLSSLCCRPQGMTQASLCKHAHSAHPAPNTSFVVTAQSSHEAWASWDGGAPRRPPSSSHHICANTQLQTVALF